jgi:hypothetical protein
MQPLFLPARLLNVYVDFSIMFQACIFGFVFLQNMSPIMKKNIEPCAFSISVY